MDRHSLVQTKKGRTIDPGLQVSCDIFQTVASEGAQAEAMCELALNLPEEQEDGTHNLLKLNLVPVLEGAYDR